jgi:hypothetical protein
MDSTKTNQTLILQPKLFNLRPVSQLCRVLNHITLNRWRSTTSVSILVKTSTSCLNLQNELTTPHNLMRPRTGKSKANSNTIRPKKNTFNSGDSPVVTHLTTSPPVRCLNRAERTGSLVLNVLWSNVKKLKFKEFIFAFANPTHLAIPFEDMLFP